MGERRTGSGPLDEAGRELEHGLEQVERRLGFRDRYIRRNRTAHAAWRVVVALAGTAVVVLGVVLLPLPGPGWLIIFAGLALLASEFVWAQRLLHFARDRVTAWTRWVARQPVPVRVLIALGFLALVLVLVGAYLAVVGVPGWLDAVLPDGLLPASWRGR